MVTTDFPTDLDGLQAILRSIDAASCPQTYNFHLHTLHSDGRLQPQQLIQQAIDSGLKSLAITDHHSVEGYWLAVDYLHSQGQTLPQPLPKLWSGIEITSLLLNTQIHILGYGFDPNHPALHPYRQGSAPQGDQAEGEQVIQAIHKAGGLAVLAHPARYRRPAQELVPAAVSLGIDGIETFYCYGNIDPWQPSSSETAVMAQLASQHGLIQTCGTDTHGLDIHRRL
ncbi:MAG: PHP domain-containing protein [Acaryochloridaceae cyanobacterium CSU_3_4]|nr:PHP domain-containing protein [Acaryochloridaceae cyanobacterium CSU_3_4]